MKISLLIPVRGHWPDPLLAATLASIAAQDHANREVLLLLPDGIPGTGFPPLPGETKRVPVPAGITTGETLNHGLHVAGGDVLAHLEPGERLHPGALSLASGSLARRPAGGAVYGETYGLTADGTPGGPRLSGAFDLDRLRGECFLMRPAVFWRRTVLDAAGVFDETLEGDAADYDFWLRLGAEGAVHHLAGCLLGGGWPVRGRGCGSAAMLEVARQHGADAAALNLWLRRLAAEQTGGGKDPGAGEDHRGLSPRERCGYVGRLLVAAAELGVPPDPALLAELDAELAEVDR